MGAWGGLNSLGHYLAFLGIPWHFLGIPPCAFKFRLIGCASIRSMLLHIFQNSNHASADMIYPRESPSHSFDSYMRSFLILMSNLFPVSLIDIASKFLLLRMHFECFSVCHGT